jgi:uncharacterized membrane protein YbhN (UPF0104 family)
MIAFALSYLPAWWRALKWVIFSLILCFIGYKLGRLSDFFQDQYQYFQTNLWRSRGWWWWSAFGLCSINWLFEALKWKEVTRAWVDMTMKSAIKSVVIGQALNLITPASVGHFAGRWGMVGGDGWKTASAVLICQITQMTVTFVAFLIGWTYWKSIFPSFQVHWTFVLGGIALILLAFLLSKQIQALWWKKIQEGWKQIPLASLVRIGTYSLLRYVVFTTQFVLVLFFLGAKNSVVELAAAISLVFMAKSLMPSVHFLSDLGIREFCALLFLPAIGLPEPLVVAASLWVWTINVLIPSMAGAFWLLRIKVVEKWN